VLAVGEAVWAIRDPAEYERLRNETAQIALIRDG
jgi:hypothetical protein